MTTLHHFGEIMALVIGIVIGGLIGAGLVYLTMSNTLSQKKQELEQAKRTIEEMERTRESRLRAATESLRNDFQRRLEQRSGAGEIAPERATTIQTNRQTTIQPEAEKSTDSSAEPEPPTTPQPEPQSEAEEPSNVSSEPVPEAKSGSPEPESVAEPEPESARPSGDLPDPKEPKPLVRGTMAPVTDATQTEISFVRSGLTDAQKQELVRVVLNMGQAKQVSHLPELQRLSLFSSAEVRKAVAIAIGEIASAHSNVPAVRQTVPLLGRLSQDPDSTVRFAAAESLGSIQSSRVIPYVRRLLRDPDMAVVSVARTVMERFKYYSSTTPKPARKKSYGPKSNT